MSRLATVVITAMAAVAPTVAAAPFQDALVQTPTLTPPQRGSLAGTLSRLAFGPGDLARGAFQLALPIELPGDRGALLANVLPSYSPEAGQSEWGVGWQADLAIRRHRALGEVDFATDDFTTPWGRVVAGDDGRYYVAGLTSRLRLTRTVPDGWLGEAADGTQYRFDPIDAVGTPRGTFAWMLSRVDNLVGDSTTLTWTRNPSGRPVLAAVAWGGRHDGTQYQLAFSYEVVPTPFVSLASGTRQVIDQRVTRATLGVRQGASYTTRWRYDLTYQGSPTGPGSYLHQIVRTLASGASDPPVIYDYDRGSELLATSQPRVVPGLDAVLAAYGTGALQPDRAGMTDLEQDGLTDLEIASDLKTIRQTEAGFVLEALPAATGTSSLCRPSPAAANKPRLLARLHGDAAAPDVVVTTVVGAATRLLICDRLGVPKLDQQLATNWTLGANTRLADLDADQRPDLVRLGFGRVEVLRNTSTSPQALAFTPGPVTTLTPSVTPVTTWVLDQNGDGRADLVVRHQSGVIVWLGRGGSSFEPAGASYPFRTAAGQPITGFAGYQISHGDFNGDGLSDAVLSANGTARLYTNRGGAYVETAVPGLGALPTNAGFPVVADVAATGNEAIVVASAGRALALDLTSPSTGLLRAVDDGRGTTIQLGYGRARATPGTLRRSTTLTTMTVASSGYDPVTYEYGYGAPVVHSAGKFLVGFASVTKRSPLLTEQTELDHDDDVSGVPRRSEAHDDRTPGIVRFERHAYDAVTHHGVAWRRPALVERGYRSGAATLASTVRYTAYERGFCPTVVSTTSPSGQLITTTALATIAAIPDETHCLSSSQSLAGIHADPTRDFSYLATLDRDALGQVTRITQHAPPLPPLVLQDISYDADQRVAAVTIPGQGTTVPSYDAVGRLTALTDPLGVVTQVDEMDPVSDTVLALRTARPGAPVTSYFEYDARERLRATWDDVSGATPAQPLASYTYQDATLAAPGRIDATALADAITGTARSTATLVAADGEPLVTGTWLGDRYALGRAAIAVRATRTHRSSFIGTLSAATLATLTSADLRALGTPLTETAQAGFGHPVQATTTYQADVVGTVTSELLLDASELVTRTHQPGGFTAEVAVDAAGQLVRKTDENGVVHRYGYDALGRLIRLDTPDGGHHQTFDGFGRPARISRDGIGAITYLYDATTGLPIRRQQLDAAGAVVASSDLSYDAVGRTTQIAQSAPGDARTVGFDHDGALDGTTQPGQLGRLSRVRGDGWERSAVFDALGRPTTQRLVLAGWRELTTDKAYRADGSIATDTVTIRDAAGAPRFSSTKRTVLDAIGRVAALEVDGAVLYTVSYDAEGRLARADLRSGEAIAFDYDPVTHARRGHRVEAPAASGGVHWDHDARGLVAAETYDHAATSTQRAYTYDGRGALTGSTTASDATSYTYTASGLPDFITDPAGARSVRRAGRQLTAGDVSYTWDSAGRVSGKAGWTFGYGANGQLRRADRPGRQLEFVYDEADQRLLKRVDGVPVRAHVAGGVLTEDRFVELVTIGGVVAGVLDNGQFTALLTDPRGTPFAGPDGAPGLATPYGVRTSHLGLAEVIDYARLGWDPDLDVIRMGVRDYDAKLGQFLTPDPLYFEDLERCQASPVQCALYGYAAGNPISFVDPTGTDAGGAPQTPEDAARIAASLAAWASRAGIRTAATTAISTVTTSTTATAMAEAAAPIGAGLLAVAPGIAIAGQGYVTASRVGSISGFGTPYSAPRDAIAFPTLRNRWLPGTPDGGSGGDSDRDRGRNLTFYRGTYFYDAAEVVQERGFDAERIADKQSRGSHAPGLYLTTQFSTAMYYADLAGGNGRGGGPAILQIKVNREAFTALAATYGIAVETLVPQPPTPGQTETRIPLDAIDGFNATIEQMRSKP
jgi:RHS repeat-associated protein